MEYNPPGSLTAKGWRLFKQEFKEKAPIRYWLKNDLRYRVILPVKWKIDKIKDWVRYRTYARYHIIETELEPGYHETESRMLYSSFSLLKDFVEIQLAWNSYWSERRENVTFWQKHLPFYIYNGFKSFRSRELGLKHLDWAATLDDPSLPPYERSDHQAVAAREIRELYLWWVDTRPNRKLEETGTYSDQGLDILGVLDDDFDREAPDYKKYRSAMDRNAELEEKWRIEDTEMLIRLVKIRQQLWT